MRIDHVEVALVDRDVDRLADGSAAVVEVRRGVGQLHEVPEVLDRAVTPAVVEVAHERRAVVRCEYRVHPADLDVVGVVACVLGELARGAGLDDLAAHPAGEADQLAVDVGAGVTQRPEGIRVAAEDDADLLEDRIRVVLDEREALPRRGPRTVPASGSGTAFARSGSRGGRPPSLASAAAPGRCRTGHRSSSAFGTGRRAARRRRRSRGRSMLRRSAAGARAGS